jgi:type III restriction enzyme
MFSASLLPVNEFAVLTPEVITGDNYESRGALLDDVLRCKINIFNISKITSEVRGGKQMRIRSFKEELGDSYFDYLSKQHDLVMLMDESHRYRATAGMRAINELKPVLGLELTATPFVEGSKGPVAFRNVVFDYPLARAMDDGFVKDPAVVTRKNFIAAGKSPEAIQQMKLEDGIRLHESVKVELETYARENGVKIVKPFVLVIARDTTHAAELMKLIQSEAFFKARYADKVIQVDSSVKAEETVDKLLTVERADNPVEIVIHVNMLKEGWDVTNLYTIVPLRAANARTLIEQSIGRGLRLPYRTETSLDLFAETISTATRTFDRGQIESYAKGRLETIFKYVSEPLPLLHDTGRQMFSLFCLSNSASDSAIKLIKNGVQSVLKKHGPAASHRRSGH